MYERIEILHTQPSVREVKTGRDGQRKRRKQYLKSMDAFYVRYVLPNESLQYLVRLSFSSNFTTDQLALA